MTVAQKVIVASVITTGATIPITIPTITNTAAAPVLATADRGVLVLVGRLPSWAQEAFGAACSVERQEARQGDREKEWSSW